MKIKILFILIVSVCYLIEVRAEAQEVATPLTPKSENSFQNTLKHLKENHKYNTIFDSDYNVPQSMWN